MITRERKRYEIEGLPPWQATETLSHRDAQRVEQALAEDGVLAQRYEFVLEELAAAIHLNDTLGPSERAVEKLFAAIDAEARLPRPPRLSNKSEKGAGPFSMSSGRSRRRNLARAFLRKRL
jgi:hypothetical protein